MILMVSNAWLPFPCHNCALPDYVKLLVSVITSSILSLKLANEAIEITELETRLALNIQMILLREGAAVMILLAGQVWTVLIFIPPNVPVAI